MTLTPRLTAFDEAVLAVLKSRGDMPGMRAGAVRARLGGWRVSAMTVREVLRGMEAVGLAENRGGWWRAT